MPNQSQAAGSFEVEFKTQKKFDVFGKEYAKCYANMDVNGTMEKPTTTGGGQLVYNVKFSLECGCDTVLTNFKKAYDKTFGNGASTAAVAVPAEDVGAGDIIASTTAAQSVKDNDWTATLLFCKLLPADTIAPSQRSPQPATQLDAPDTSETVLATDLPGQPWLEGYAIGKGVNAVTGNLADQALVSNFTITPATTQSSTMNYTNIVSSSQVEQQVQASADGSYNMDGVTITASTSFLSDIMQSELSMTVLAVYEVFYNDYDTITGNLAFTDDAQAMVNNGDFDTFRSCYGDYYIAGSKRWAFFRALFTISAQSESDLQKVQAALGANAPEMFTVQGQATFQQAVQSANVNVNMVLDMQGYSGNPPTFTGVEDVTNALTWFTANVSPIPVQAEMIHYSQIDPSIPVTLPIDPNVFGAVSSIYTDTYLTQIAWNSLASGWQTEYQAQLTNLVAMVTANAQVLVTDADQRASIGNQVTDVLNTFTNLSQRSLFISTIQALQSTEPPVGSHQSGTTTYGSVTYPNATNDPQFQIQSISQNHSEGSHAGHRQYTFNLSAGNGVIVQWEVHAVWGDGSDGEWWLEQQANSSSHILLNQSATITIKSAYDRGFDYTVYIWYVDQSLLPPLGSN